VQKRQQLSALVLIMDSRRPFTDLDLQMLEWFAPTGKPIHCLLTKADKLNRNDSTNALRMARTLLASYVDAEGKPFPFTAQLFSALKRTGLDEANDKILDLLGLNVETTAENAEGEAEAAETKAEGDVEFEDDAEGESEK
jgi:GTP-binding protein